MLLSGALFALFMTGFWLYCLTDAIVTPAPECTGLPKRAWIVLIVVTFIGGALAWLVVRQPARDSSKPLAPMPDWDPDSSDDEGYFLRQDDALARHPAGREIRTDPRQPPKGPDDDPDFLRALDRAIHGNWQAGE
jgi:hypothetical protein